MTGPIAETTAGQFEGASLDGFERYLGIPYALAPTGERRFCAPQPVEPHDGVRQAVEFGPHAPQLPSLMEEFLSEGRPFAPSERDCLRLNVWTPARDGGRRPVMVWIHGGGFTSGTSASPWYDGAGFARDHDVVVVSLNYRLGPLGFTYLGAMGGEAFAGSGTVGIQDAIEALRWVTSNIDSFGGDPGNVTIFGESAGAMSVGTLLAVPTAQGLFHKAILQSGAASTVIDVELADRYRAELCELIGDDALSVASLQRMAIEPLLKAHGALAAAHIEDGLLSRPVVDGAVLDRPPLEAVAAGAAASVPLLIGTNLDEWRLFSFADERVTTMDEATMLARLGHIVPGDPAAAARTYRARLGEAPPGQVLAAALTDSLFRIPAIRLAEAQRAAHGDAWMYLFTWPSVELGGTLGACHGLEIPFVFNTLDTQSATAFAGAGAPRTLARAMHATWASFARTGTPDGAGLGPWPMYDEARRATMVCDVTQGTETDPVAAERAIWDQ